MVKHLPTMREPRVQSLGREDLLEKEMATHPSILAWRIPWTEELGGLQPMGRKESDTTEQLHFHFHLGKYLRYMLNNGSVMNSIWTSMTFNSNYPKKLFSTSSYAIGNLLQNRNF